MTGSYSSSCSSSCLAFHSCPLPTHWIFISNCGSWQTKRKLHVQHTIVTSRADKDFLLPAKKHVDWRVLPSLPYQYKTVKLSYMSIYINFITWLFDIRRQANATQLSSCHNNDLIEKGNTYLSIILFYMEYANCETLRTDVIGVLKEISIHVLILTPANKPDKSFINPKATQSALCFVTDGWSIFLYCV